MENNQFQSLFEGMTVATVKTNNQTSSVYKTELFEGCTQKEKMSRRKKLRAFNENLLVAILRCKDNKQLKDLCSDYMAWSVKVFIEPVSEKTFSNMKQSKDFCKALEIIKSTLNKK